MSDLPRVNVLGISIGAITMRQALDQVATWIKQGAREYVCVCNVYTIMECQRNSPVRFAVNRAGLATPDGMPLVWLSRWKSRTKVSRVYGPDLMLALCELSTERGYSHYFYGGAQGVPDLLQNDYSSASPGYKS